MKVIFLWDLRVNKLEAKFIVDILIGLSMLLGGLFFDKIALCFDWRNSPTFGIAQSLWCISWATYTAWSCVYAIEWGE